MKGEEAFKEYYKFDEKTMNLLKSPQIKTFRINRSNSLHKRVEEFVKGSGCTTHQLINDLYILPKQINYYKGWDNERKKELRMTASQDNKILTDTPPENKELKQIKKVFSLLADSGLIYYQEISSFLPVHLLNVQKNHKVLDMCSAPGSKTTQLINLTNFLVANEPNSKRRNVLVTNTSKFTTNNLVITTYDARYFPLQIKFDRILCDVPCSSDGTIRKDPSILFDWSISKSKGISQLQLQILRRGLKLLKDDGILVYSTCTFNQLENENVLEEALTEEYEIINVNDSLKGLCFTNGNTFKTKNAVRILPNGEDTGGFFISVIRKKISSNTILTDSINIPNNHTNISNNHSNISNNTNLNNHINILNENISYFYNNIINNNPINYKSNDLISNSINDNFSFIKSSNNSIRLINKEMLEILNYKIDLFGIKVFDLIKINNNKIFRPLLLKYDYLISREILYSLLKNEIIIYKSDFIGFKGVFYEDINFICYFTGNKLKAYVNNKYKEMLLALVFNEFN